MRGFLYKLLEIIVVLSIVFYIGYNEYNKNKEPDKPSIISYEKSDIPEYTNESYIYINNNEPEFDDKDKNTESFESYSELDELGRCGVAYANLSKELMPTGPRERISYIKPTGWKNTKYDWIEGENLYNRCHLIAYSLSGENDNRKNLITCTRYMNATTMQTFEIQVANYIRKTNNHVLYRVTPVFDYDNLLAKGVQMEALSVEDNGEGIKFNIFVYNIEPKISIDYKTGDNRLINEN